MLVSRGLARVISDLAKMGYDAQWARFSASNFGAPHQRDRLWLVAHANGIRLETQRLTSGFPKEITLLGSYRQDVSNTQSIRWQQARENIRRPTQRFSRSSKKRSRWWGVEPGLGRVADGVANRVDRLKATGNGQVSIVAVNAYQTLGMTL